MNSASPLAPWAQSPPVFRREPSDRGEVVRLSGDWTIRTIGPIEADLAGFRRDLAAAAASETASFEFDLADLALLDTAGALVVNHLFADVPGARRTILGVDAKQRILLDEVAGADRAPARPVLGPGPVIRFVTGLGRYGLGLWSEARSVLILLGGVAVVLRRIVVQPSRIRFIPFVNQLQRTALDAAPIIILMSFLIGCIIAQQGAFYFRRFGADLYVVDMVGVLTLREIAVILTAIMVAGRSGSAFTAELGSMKMREEIDALKVIGLDPVEILVVPRMVALMIALPILTFLSDLASILGAAIVCNVYADIPTETFLYRLHAAVEMRTFLVGISKAPFMALIIALVACMQGLQVEGSAESLGRRTTMAVVKSIFMVVVVDGIFAMFYAAAGV